MTGGMLRPVLMLSLALGLGCMTAATPQVLRDRQHAALERGDVLEGVRLGRARVKQDPQDAAAQYDLACALARAGDREEALRALTEAITLGFDAPGLLLKDQDLGSLRSLPAFSALLERSRQVSEEGISLPNVRTEVRAGLRVRLPLIGRPRLAVWLHPFGARLNASIERLTPVFLAHGFALAVPIELGSPGWGEDDLHRVLALALPTLSEWVDVERPVLIGLSAGSHAALAAWARDPSRWGGVIAGACAPELHGAVLPAGGAELVVINGALDQSTDRWRAELARWQSEGRRVSFTMVPGLGHEFVFDEARLGAALSHFQ